MKRYDKYKPTGILWLPEIPEHWHNSKIKSHFRLRATKVSDKEYSALSVSKNGITPQLDSAVKTDNGDNRKLVKSGDFVVNSRSDRKGSCGISSLDGSVSLINIVLEPIDGFGQFYHHLFRSNYYIEEFYRNGRGIVSDLWTTRWNEMSSIEIPFPPTDEQKHIAAYLDKRITLIENCKCQRERELQTLNELKQAEIASVVTRGLNPNVPMKDSGIPWIGQIPEHWGIRRAKSMFKKEKREVRPTDRVITCFRDGQVTLRENRRTTGFTESITEIGYQGIRKGDLVIHQMDAFAGSIGVSDSDGKGTSVYHCCTPKGPYIPQYYALVLREMARTGFIQSLYRGIRERSSDFNFQTFGKQYLPIPPEEEQKEIVNFIHTRINKIDTMIEALKAEIDRLTEYKQRLISDVVTGQIDVRNEEI